MMMTISKALSELERRAINVLRCDSCRFSVTDPVLAYNIRGVAPDDLLPVTCRWCGWSVVYSLAGVDERERECVRIYFGASAEGRFRDPLVYAASTWIMNRSAAVKSLDGYRRRAEAMKSIEEGTFKPPTLRRRPTPERRGPASKEEKQAQREKAEREERQRRAWAFQRRMKAEERKRFGPPSFPLAAEVRAVTAEPVPVAVFPNERAGAAAREALKRFRVLELCEAALWGSALTETAAALTELRAVVAALEEEEQRKAEEKEREEREREERWKRREAEDRRRVLERMGAPSIAAAMRVSHGVGEGAAPVSRFRKAALPLGSSAALDPTAAHVPAEPGLCPTYPEPEQSVAGNSIPIAEFYDPNHPDAVQFHRSMPPDPTRGLKLEDVETERTRANDSRRYYHGENYDGDPRY